MGEGRQGIRRACRLTATGATAALTLLWGAALAAALFPSKPVRLLLGFPPGGATDLVARAIQPRMSAGFGQ